MAHTYAPYESTLSPPTGLQSSTRAPCKAPIKKPKANPDIYHPFLSCYCFCRRVLRCTWSTAAWSSPTTTTCSAFWRVGLRASCLCSRYVCEHVNMHMYYGSARTGGGARIASEVKTQYTETPPVPRLEHVDPTAVLCMALNIWSLSNTLVTLYWAL